MARYTPCNRGDGSTATLARANYVVAESGYCSFDRDHQADLIALRAGSLFVEKLFKRADAHRARAGGSDERGEDPTQRIHVATAHHRERL